MIVGVPREIKADEYRVALTPGGCEALVGDGHSVVVESGAGTGSGFEDQQYVQCGAKMVASAAEVFGEAEMIVKVKEPLPDEWPLMRRGQILFTYFHFAASRELTEAVAASGVVAIAYETIEDDSGRLPLLAPMSEVAGRMSAQLGAWCLERHTGGRGVLMGGVPGTAPANVLILGGGVAGAQAAKVSAGMGASVTLLDINVDRLRYLSDIMPANVRTLVSGAMTLRELLPTADLVIGAVPVHGGRTPVLLPREYLKLMPRNAVFVDICVDQGGCAETSRPTTHHDPVYVEEGVLHYCVANMPGAVPRTSTVALTNSTMPYALKLANLGWREAARADASLAAGVNIAEGAITYPGVAEAHNMPLTPLKL